MLKRRAPPGESADKPPASRHLQLAPLRRRPTSYSAASTPTKRSDPRLSAPAPGDAARTQSACVVLREIPIGTVLYIDGARIRVGAEFRGFRDVPPGEHNIDVADPSGNLVPFTVTAKKGMVVVLRLEQGKLTEDKEHYVQFAKLAISGALDSALIAYSERNAHDTKTQKTVPRGKAASKATKLVAPPRLSNTRLMSTDESDTDDDTDDTDDDEDIVQCARKSAFTLRDMQRVEDVYTMLRALPNDESLAEYAAVLAENNAPVGVMQQHIPFFKAYSSIVIRHVRASPEIARAGSCRAWIDALCEALQCLDNHECEMLSEDLREHLKRLDSLA